MKEHGNLTLKMLEEIVSSIIEDSEQDPKNPTILRRDKKGVINYMRPFYYTIYSKSTADQKLEILENNLAEGFYILDENGFKLEK